MSPHRLKSVVSPTGLPLPFGKHKGKLVDVVVLSHPEYIAWLDRQQQKLWWCRDVYDHIDDCIAAFDAKPFTVGCFGRIDHRQCLRAATRLSLCPPSTEPYFWCDHCNPYQAGADGRLILVRTYREALRYVEVFCAGLYVEHRAIVRAMHEGKGLTGKRTRKKILSFLTAPQAAATCGQICPRTTQAL